MSQDRNNLIWIDLEMTGLDPDKDRIIEIATLVTDAQLQVIAEGPNLVIHQSDELLNGMDEWNTSHHGASGLTAKVRESQISEAAAEEQTLAFLSQYVAEGASPMCGNSICQDRRFLWRYMPRLEAFFHYRHIDVSTLKELRKRWQPDAEKFDKESNHRALEDIHDSIAELQFYRDKFING